MDAVTFLIGLVVFCFIGYILYLIAQWAIGAFGIPAPLAHIMLLIVGLVLFLMFLDVVGLYPTGMAPFRFPRRP